ncbi:MAG: DUF3800 domain-containing protein [Conexivisphaerales archaeon]
MHSIHIFVDEAGDLGFSDKSTKTFVIAYIMPMQPERIRTQLKRLMRRLNTSLKLELREFKHSRDSEQVRDKVFELIRTQNIQAGIMAIEKSSVKHELRGRKNILYNFLVVDKMIKDALKLYPKTLEIVLDRSMSKESIADFNRYVKWKVDWNKRTDSVAPVVHVSHVDSTKEKCIQVADYIAGACFARFERKYNFEYNKIKDKIIYKHQWGEIDW